MTPYQEGQLWGLKAAKSVAENRILQKTTDEWDSGWEAALESIIEHLQNMIKARE